MVDNRCGVPAIVRWLLSCSASTRSCQRLTRQIEVGSLGEIESTFFSDQSAGDSRIVGTVSVGLESSGGPNRDVGVEATTLLLDGWATSSRDSTEIPT